MLLTNKQTRNKVKLTNNIELEVLKNCYRIVKVKAVQRMKQNERNKYIKKLEKSK